MGIYQADIFGGKKEIKRKKSVKKSKELKEKYRTLYTLYERLYEQFNINLFEEKEIIIKGNIIIYPQDKQAEPAEAIDLDLGLDERIEIMREALKCQN